MTISKMCLECLKFTVEQGVDCAGKDAADVKPGKLPCKNYELDESLISNQNIEPDDVPPSLKDKKPSKPKDLVPDAVLPTNKVKADKFKRLATQRLVRTLDDMRKLGNLSAKASYEWNSEQIESMAGRLHGAADEFKRKFQK